MNIKKMWRGAALLAFAGVLVLGFNTIGQEAAAQNTATARVPIYQLDPSFPKPLPNGWVLGEVAAVSVDANDNVWILHRFRNVKPELKAAPPVVQFDSAGNFMKAWGGPGEGYDWVNSEHGLSVDHKGFVWVGGEGGTNQALKFTQDGKFVMQIGKKGASKGHTDTENFVGPADVFVWPKTNELFVGDTGGGRARIMVMDADTGKFKRMWGGFGNPPANAPANEGGGRAGAMDVDNGADPQYLREAHRVRVSNDGFVYTVDGTNKRFHVYTVDGKFVKQVYVERGKKPLNVIPNVNLAGYDFESLWGESYKLIAKEQLIDHHETASGVALSTDPEQQYLYVYERSRSKIQVYDRKSLTLLTEFGDGPGRAPGQFYIIHDMRADSHNNVYVSEVNIGSRVQRFNFKGYLSPAAAK